MKNVDFYQILTRSDDALHEFFNRLSIEWYSKV